MASGLGSLKAVAACMLPGTSVVLDDWTPRLAKDGRGCRMTPDELKNVTDTCCYQTTGKQIRTLYGDTVLSVGGRVFTTNATSVEEWWSGLSNRWATYTDAQRADCEHRWLSADCLALHKLALIHISPCRRPYPCRRSGWHGSGKSYNKQHSRMKVTDRGYVRVPLC